MRKIAILGLADNTRAEAPTSSEDWEIWALGWDPVSRADRLFEMHPRGHWEAQPERLAYYRTVTKPVYMAERHEDIPGCRRYPLEAVTALTGRYIESSIGYMLGLAILESAERIGLWGVDMRTGEEHGYQRPNAEYLIGFARGRGQKVYVPQESALLSSCWRSGIYGNMDPR